jgi:hypothetical protein
MIIKEDTVQNKMPFSNGVAHSQRRAHGHST